MQDTVSEMAKQMKSSKTGETQASAAELYAFMKRVRAGEPVSDTQNQHPSLSSPIPEPACLRMPAYLFWCLHV